MIHRSQHGVALEHATDLAQGVVAGQVAVQIVEALEVVDVEQQQRQRLFVALRACAQFDLGRAAGRRSARRL
jgi:hypothetical protein